MSNCEICDRPLATEDDCKHPEGCAHCEHLCWNAYEDAYEPDGCRKLGLAINWRERALAAEARVKLLEWARADEAKT